MRKVWNIGWVMTCILILGSTQVLADGNHKGSYVREAVQISDHQIFNTDIEVNGATSLFRDYKNKVITATVSTGALEPNFAYSIWWVVFNSPKHCITPYACGLGDLEVNNGDPRVKNSVFYGGGMVADGTGYANTVMKLVPGRTKRELFAASKDWGLRNLRGAEIHVVLRSHGLAGIAGPVSKQIGTAADACPATGCANVFASVHLADK